MAEERNVGLARATEPEIAEDSTKEELQRRMEEARESITQTVTEIKETVATQYQNVKTTINESLDWREQFRRRPLPFAIGALGVGLVLGYSIGGALAGAGSDDDDDDDDYDTEDAALLSSTERTYAPQAITGGSAYGSTAYPQAFAASAASASDVGPSSRPSYSAGYEAQASGGSALSSQESASDDGSSDEADKPGLMDRFKETKAYDRLQGELSTLGDRAIDELSKTAQAVVLPMIFGKIKDLIGIDLSTQREVAQRSRLEQESAKAGAATSAATKPQGSSQGGF